MRSLPYWQLRKIENTALGLPCLTAVQAVWNGYLKRLNNLLHIRSPGKRSATGEICGTKK